MRQAVDSQRHYCNFCTVAQHSTLQSTTTTLHSDHGIPDAVSCTHSINTQCKLTRQTHQQPACQHRKTDRCTHHFRNDYCTISIDSSPLGDRDTPDEIFISSPCFGSRDRVRISSGAAWYLNILTSFGPVCHEIYSGGTPLDPK
jgi:hypothetical protein